MRKILIGALIFSAISIASAQTAAVCTDLPSNLSRGYESSHVMALQQFLYAKGFLKAAPVGYFGPATLAAVKVYQANAGLPATGNVFALTRASIKKDSCTTGSSSQVVSSVVSASLGQASSSVFVSPPKIVSLEGGTLFANASTTWNLVIIGSSLSTSTNTVYFRNTSNNRRYMIGTFPSLNNNSITLPSSITKSTFSCGLSCQESLPPGDYEISLLAEGGESNSVRTSIKSFAVNSTSGSPYVAVRQNATGTLIGVVSLSTSVPYYISGLTANVTSEGFQGGAGLTNVVLKDQITKEVISSYDPANSLSANQSKIIGIYGDIDSYTSGYVRGTLLISLTDYVGKQPVSILSPEFSITVSGI